MKREEIIHLIKEQISLASEFAFFDCPDCNCRRLAEKVDYLKEFAPRLPNQPPKCYFQERRCLVCGGLFHWKKTEQWSKIEPTNYHGM